MGGGGFGWICLGWGLAGICLGQEGFDGLFGLGLWLFVVEFGWICLDLL